MKDSIVKIAHSITKKYGTSSPFSLCDYIGVPVVKMEIPESMKGFCFKKESGGSVIVLNDSLSYRESSYCCAHELGHVLLHPKINVQVVKDLTNLCIRRYEKEADFFAACLFIDPNMNEWNETYDPLTCGQIASLSGLPERVVLLRFEN
jgi:Zn-dependent peptidase ImmA (M78 family)